MNRSMFIFMGILGTLALSFWSLIFIPQMQIGRQEAVMADDGYYPVPRSGLAKRGADVYRAEGCFECHSQQVRDRSFGTDLKRGFGPRFTVAQDYLGDSIVMLGLQRIGPDLANIGLRQPDINWHLRHLYDPKSVVPRSLMPPYRYLFEKRRLGPGQKPSEGALKIDNTPEGYEIIPSDTANALAFYLVSLRSHVDLFEAPVPRPKTAGTNAAPGEATNATNAASAPVAAPAQAGPAK